MSSREDALKFETGRIKALQEERLHIQKKTFTKWMNSFLTKVRMEVEDLFKDLADGKKLLKLLEIISGEKLGKPNNGLMRVHKIENVNKSLAFLHTKVRLESIGAEDIVDGNPMLILGLIWTIILRFQIQEIEIDVDEENETSEKKSAKDALLLWCQRRTNGYSGVNIQDFTGSWRNGLGFNALIHAHRSDLIDYDRLIPSRHIDNLNNAFLVAERDLGIPSLLDAEDIDVAKPDEKSVLTYVASYYHTFARIKNEIKGGRRIANIVGEIMEVDRLKQGYEFLMTDLLTWIQSTIVKLDDRSFPNSLPGIQGELSSFKKYRTEEKPPKFQEKSELEASYFNINSRLKELGQGGFSTKDGHGLHDLEIHWAQLETSENRREFSLREELLKQTYLRQLADKFEKKSGLREGYLKDMIQVLSDKRYGISSGQVEATFKKHESITSDILAREERCGQLRTMAEYLSQENYHDSAKITLRANEILLTWEKLLALLEAHRIKLDSSSSLIGLLREVDAMSGSVSELGNRVQSGEIGTHLLDTENLIQRHSLLESQVLAMGEKLKSFNKAALTTPTTGEGEVLQTRLQVLGEDYVKLLKKCEERRENLEDARSLFQFIQDFEEEEGWLAEKQRICKSAIVAKDLRGVLSSQQKHKGVLDEIRARVVKSDKLIETGEELIGTLPSQKGDIQTKIESMRRNWTALRQSAAEKEKKLRDAAEAYQFYSDANEADSWLSEKRPLVSSTDYGGDETSGRALLRRHKALVGEITAYEGDIKTLSAQFQNLSSLTLPHEDDEGEGSGGNEEWSQEQKLVPQEYWEDEAVERTEFRTILEEKGVAQVKALYNFMGQDIEMEKGEIMFLLSKTNNDWWNVRQKNGNDGFVPANYVKEIEPKVVQVQIRKPETVVEMKRVKKTKMILQNVMVKKEKPTPQGRGGKKSKENEPIEKRLNRIIADYSEICQLAKKRHQNLEDAILLFRFFAHCNDFEKWIHEKMTLLQSYDKNESIENSKRKFEEFLNDLSASSKRVDEINKEAEELMKSNHPQKDKVLSRQKEIAQLYKKLNELKALKEKSIQGASSVELYNRKCDETVEWINEKSKGIDESGIGEDLKTVRSLQLRHSNLEREVSPIGDRVTQLLSLASSVKASYPLEKGRVDERQREIEELWSKLQLKVAQRRFRLEEAVGKQIFMKSSGNYLDWIKDTERVVSTYETARDVFTAEEIMKKHGDIGDDISAHEPELREIFELGNSLLGKAPNPEVSSRLEVLKSEEEKLRGNWAKKGKWAAETMELQLFNREADQIDTSTSAHFTFLEYNNQGSSLDEVEGLIKRHTHFQKSLLAQDEKLASLAQMAQNLIASGHPLSKEIEERKNNVFERRELLKEKEKERMKGLLESLSFHEFKTDVEELEEWIVEKGDRVRDESYKDLTNLERKTQTHEAFARELRANETRLRTINKTGSKLSSRNPGRESEITALLHSLNASWDELRKLAEEKGAKLAQAAEEHSFNKKVESILSKLSSLEQRVTNSETGGNRRECRELVKTHEGVESEISGIEGKIGEMLANGEELSGEGHFNAVNIQNRGTECREKLAQLQSPVQKKRRDLEEASAYFEFLFEVETQLGWIGEKRRVVGSDTLPSDLHSAQSLAKKQKKMEEEIKRHEPSIQKTLNEGKALLEKNNQEKENIKSEIDKLKKSWADLEKAASERTKRLDLALKAQQYFNESSEVETWMNERTNFLSSVQYGNNKDASIQLLRKHKAIELEIDSYNGLVKEIRYLADSMINSKHPDSKIIKNIQEGIEQQMSNLKVAANERRKNLVEWIKKHEYLSDVEEFEKWVDEQMVVAKSDDYGHDYEHLLFLQSNFNEFKVRVFASSHRFELLDEMAKKILSANHDYDSSDEISTLIPQKHAIICDKWGKLLETIESRDRKLEGAGEIHRFHRDVSEALSTIQEKSLALPDDLGSNATTCENMLRAHEVFETDLLALEAQLQVLVDDAVRLSGIYPANAENIRHEQTAVVESWGMLQNKTGSKREELQGARDYYKLSADIRDLMTWIKSLETLILQSESGRSMSGAQELLTEHDSLWSEIQGREEKFEDVSTLAQLLLDSSHPKSPEIHTKVQELLTSKQNLISAWNRKKIYLDQLYDYSLFTRDAKLVQLFFERQIATFSTPPSNSPQEVERSLKKHEADEKLIALQSDKFNSLAEQGAKLLSQSHFESNNIKVILSNLNSLKAQMNDLCQRHKENLGLLLNFHKFLSSVSEAESSIVEKSKRLEYEKSLTPDLSLESKIKKLKKYEVFRAELSSNEAAIHEITSKGKELSEFPSLRPEVDKRVERVVSSWYKLVSESESWFDSLKEAQGVFEILSVVERVEGEMREKESLVSGGDLGRDFEHCVEIVKKVEGGGGEERIGKELEEVGKMVRRMREGKENEALCGVEERTERLRDKWAKLTRALKDYREMLRIALEIHKFTRDVDDTNERILDKIKLMSLSDTGRDLDSVQILIRRQETIDRDVSALKTKIKELEQEKINLLNRHPNSGESLRKKMEQLTQSWNALQETRLKRKEGLSDSLRFHKFVKEVKKCEIWVDEIVTKFESKEVPSTETEADEMLSLHEEIKAEIKSHSPSFINLQENGAQIMKETQIPHDKIESYLEILLRLEERLRESLEGREKCLREAKQLQKFNVLANETENILREKEAFLNNRNIGDSISSVETLLKKFDDFEKRMSLQLKKVEDLKNYASSFVLSSNYSKESLMIRLKDIEERRENLKSLAKSRKSNLLESRALFSFLRNVNEVKGYILTKLGIANDKNYEERTNLQSKISKHLVFESEISANESRIHSLVEEGEKLVHSDHFASRDIVEKMEELNKLWKELLGASGDKKQKLHQAYQALLFSQVLDDFEIWIEELESQLESEDHGKDLNSVKILLKKWLMLQRECANQADQIKKIQESAAAFRDSSHFLKDEIGEKVEKVVEKYNSLQEPLEIRRENLEEAQKFYQFIGDAQDEIDFLTEKQILIDSNTVGPSLTAVEQSIKNHDALEAEIQSHEHLIESLCTRGESLVNSHHYASDKIQSKISELSSLLSSIQLQSKEKREILVQTLAVQKFNGEATEAKLWIKLKSSPLLSSDFGKDEESVKSLSKKLQFIQIDLENYEKNIKRLVEWGSELIKENNAVHLEELVSDLKEEFSNLQKLCDKRRQGLSDSEKLFKFLRESEFVEEWIGAQMHVAGSEDYGRDVEHVEILIQKFASLIENIKLVGENRIAVINNLASNLIEEGHPDSALISRKVGEINMMWDDFSELASARSEALSGAKLVHMFDRTADETIGWILEKESAASAPESGHDLESTQALLRKQAEFELDLEGVKQSVEIVSREAAKLCKLFPDASEHIQVKETEMKDYWTLLIHKSNERRVRLEQAEDIENYFDEWRELIGWINETRGKILGPQIPKSIGGVESIIESQSEIEREIERKKEEIEKFKTRGNTIVQSGHLFSPQILEKIGQLSGEWESLMSLSSARLSLYLDALDSKLFLRDASALEVWLSGRESKVFHSSLGDTLFETEELVRQMEEMEESGKVVECRVENLRRKTRVEEGEEERVKRKREEEEERRKKEERGRVIQAKSREVQRIIEERNREKVDRLTDYNEERPLYHLPLSTTSKVYRSESFRSDEKPLKKTPSFTTRRRTQSFRKFKGLESDSRVLGRDLRSEMSRDYDLVGWLERKHELGSGGKRSPIRSWKEYYVTLSSHTLFFFRSVEEASSGGKIGSGTISIQGAKVTRAADYIKRKYVFRLHLVDGSVYLFTSDTEGVVEQWIEGIARNAKLLLENAEISNIDTLSLPNDINTNSRRPSLPPRLPCPEKKEKSGRLDGRQSIPSDSSPTVKNRHSDILDSGRRELRGVKTGSLPSGVKTRDDLKDTSFHDDENRRFSECSSDSDTTVQSSKEKKSGRILSFLRRKKATQL